MAARPDYPLTLLSIDQFLAISFGEQKAELDDGIIRMMAGAKARHNRVTFNVQLALGRRLEGSGCTPYGSDMGVRTRDQTLRYPDVSVFCGHDEAADDDARVFADPRIVFEILSAGTSRTDLREKLPEYQAMASVDTIVLIDIATERLRVVQRIGSDGWMDTRHADPNDLALPSLGLTIAHAEIFARR